jgi:hypothetical protein
MKKFLAFSVFETVSRKNGNCFTLIFERIPFHFPVLYVCTQSFISPCERGEVAGSLSKLLLYTKYVNKTGTARAHKYVNKNKLLYNTY